MVEWRSPKPFIRVRVLVSLSCPCVWIRENLYFLFSAFISPLVIVGYQLPIFSRYRVIDWETWLNFNFSFINPLVIVGYQLPHKSSCHNGYWSRLLICRAKAHCRFESYRGRSNLSWTVHAFTRTNMGCSQMEYVHHRKIENERWLITRCYWRIIILAKGCVTQMVRVVAF